MLLLESVAFNYSRAFAPWSGLILEVLCPCLSHLPVLGQNLPLRSLFGRNRHYSVHFWIGSIKAFVAVGFGSHYGQVEQVLIVWQPRALTV